MGDVEELLERIYFGLKVTDEIESTNLYAYLYNKEYIYESIDQDGSKQATITVKGDQFLAALYLLRLEQTPNNFFSREYSKTLIVQLKNDGYITDKNDGASNPSFEITSLGQTMLASLEF